MLSACCAAARCSPAAAAGASPAALRAGRPRREKRAQGAWQIRSGATHLCGPIHSAFATFTRAEPKAEEYQRSAEVLHAAGDYAKQAGVILVPEAINRFECYLCNTMAQLRSLIELTDHPNVRGMFDTHHANI